MIDNESAYKFYSFGIVAADKERKSPYIKVVPVEQLPLSTGKNESTVVKAKGNNRPNVNRKEDKASVPMGKQTVKYDVQIPDHQKVSRSEKVDGDLMIIAQWTALGQSNRITPPDVRQGETVMILRVADTDEYFWITMMNEPSIRRQETVCYIFGNIPDGTVAWDKDSSYWMEVSTHDKHIKLHTSKNDGEAAAWDLSLNTSKGILSFTDNAGNEMTLDSPNGKLTITTNTDVEVNTQKVVVNASTSCTINAPAITLNGNTTINGSITLNGGTSVAGNTTITGNVMVKGNFGTADGDVTLTGGSITANGEDLNTDIT